MPEAQTRTLTIALRAVSGAINRFYAFLDGRKVIAADGTDQPSHSEAVSLAAVKLQVRVFGIGSARYELTIDLPGTADDQKLTLSLSGGYHELDLVL